MNATQDGSPINKATNLLAWKKAKYSPSGSSEQLVQPSPRAQ